MSISNTRGLDELPPIITDVPRVELEQPPPPGHVAPFLQVEDVVVGTVRNNGTEDVCVNVGDDGGSCDSDSETSYTEREDADESGGGLRRDGECGDGCEGCDDEGNGSGVGGVSGVSGVSGVGGVSSGGVSGVSAVSGNGGGGGVSSPHLHHLNYKIGDELVPVEYEKLTYNDVAKKINRDYQPVLFGARHIVQLSEGPTDYLYGNNESSSQKPEPTDAAGYCHLGGLLCIIAELVWPRRRRYTRSIRYERVCSLSDCHHQLLEVGC